MKELREDIQKKAFRPCYLLFGPEAYLKSLWAERLEQALAADDASGMNLNKFEGPLPPGPVLSAADTIPFLAERRGVVWSESGLFAPGRQKEAEEVAAYLPNIPPTTCLVFVESQVDKRSRLLKLLEKTGLSVECKVPTERELTVWLQKKATEQGRELDVVTTKYLLTAVGMDMQTLDLETDKLFSYPGSGPVLTQADVDAVCSKTLEASIFELVDAIGRREASVALQKYQDMLLLKERVPRILSMIIRQFRLLYQCRTLQERGEGVSAIAAQLSQKEFVVRKLLSQAKNFDLSTLEQALKDCLAADLAFKTGKMSDELSVELLILRYCGK